jgi:NAD+ diphosphatase
MSSSARSRNNTFSSLILERNSESRDDDAFVQARLTAPNARFLLLRADGRALVNATGDALLALNQAQRADAFAEAAPPIYLGSSEDEWFLLRADEANAERIAAQTLGRFLDLRGAGLALPAFDAGLFAYARALANWQARMRYCNVCAAPLKFVAAGHRAKCTNPQCATEHFPRTDPAIIVIVTRGDACLLGRQAGWPARRYSTLAGFLEPGETLEDCVRREVFEESGVRVTDCDYHSSQPWPFPAAIMLGFTAQAQDATIQIGSELEDARWFTAAQIVDGLAAGELLLSPPLSISFRLIELWMAGYGVDLTALVMRHDPLLAARR